MSVAKNTKDKMIPDPEDPEKEIENPDYVEPEDDENEDEDEDELSEAEKAKLEALVGKKLKKMKANLDKAYALRDEAQTEAAKLAQEKEDARIEKLKAEGKLEEAHAAEKTRLENELSTVKKQLVSLTRDRDVRDALAGFEFRNDKSRKMALREITEELVQDDTGVWKHKTGASIEAFAKTFMESDDNSFLLKPKVNKGGGTDKSDPPKKDDKKTGKFLGRPASEVLQEIRDKRAKAQ
jgi:hypothetical protein